jgi:2-haloacid dehalogenase
MSKVLVFDVNETLLDLSVLDPHFDRIFGDSLVRSEWFGLVLRNAMTLTITGDYTDFVTVGGASLQMVADVHGVEPSNADRSDIREAMTSMPAHADVLPALDRLHAAGFRMAALTNSPRDAAVSQLTNAGIAPLFESIMSVEAAGRFKPAAEVYEMAAERLGVSTEGLMMVAAHDWDIAGAMRAGCAGAYVMRPGTAANPLYPPPDITGPDLLSVSEQIITS